MQNEFFTAKNYDVWLGVSAAQLRRFRRGLRGLGGRFGVAGNADNFCFAKKD